MKPIAWRRLEKRGMEVREWHVNPDTGQLELETLAGLLDEKVRLVCFPHCSNIIGQENPVAEAVGMAHAGAVTCVDGVSMAPHGFPDIGALGTDIYLFSSYKTYGPHQGVMVVKRELPTGWPIGVSSMPIIVRSVLPAGQTMPRSQLRLVWRRLR